MNKELSKLPLEEAVDLLISRVIKLEKLVADQQIQISNLSSRTMGLVRFGGPSQQARSMVFR